VGLEKSEGPATAKFVEATARQIGLSIREEDLARVNEDMARLASVAEFLMQFPLSQETEAAPVFQP
jgi:hypothetical protein